MFVDANWNLFFALYILAHKPKVYGRYLAFSKWSRRGPEPTTRGGAFWRYILAGSPYSPPCNWYKP